MWKVEKIVKKGDYLYAVVPNHPQRTRHNYVLLHRVVMENHLGRLLDPTEVVHHKDGNKHHNEIANLEVMLAREHARLHGRQTLRKIVTLCCPQCGGEFERYHNQYASKRSRYGAFCSPKCRGQFSARVQHHGLTAEMQNAVSVNLQGIRLGKLPSA